jgi:hypothetical protein
MQGEELINICQAVQHGSRRFVNNTSKNAKGRVLGCGYAGLEVEVDAGTEVWQFEDCAEDMGGGPLDRPT